MATGATHAPLMQCMPGLRASGIMITFQAGSVQPVCLLYRGTMMRLQAAVACLSGKKVGIAISKHSFCAVAKLRLTGPALGVFLCCTL